MIKKWLGITALEDKAFEYTNIMARHEARINLLEYIQSKPASYKDLRTKHIKCEKVSFTCHRDANGRFAKKG